MEPINTDRADPPRFRRRWWGYDRQEVEDFLRQTAAERQRHQESLIWLEALMAGYDQQNRDAVLAASRRESHEARIAELRATAAGRRGRAEAGPSPADPSAAGAMPFLGSLRPVSRRHVYALLLCAFLSATLFAALKPDPGTSDVRALPAAGQDGAALKPSSVPTATSEPAATGVPAAASVPAAGGSASLPSDSRGRAVVEPPTGEPSPPAAATDGLVLTLTALRSCWIGTTIDGGQRLERLLKPDETVMLHAHDEVVLRVGDAAALSVLINNQPMTPLGAAGQVVTRRISRANYLNLLVP
jgi:hypothetical protein